MKASYLFAASILAGALLGVGSAASHFGTFAGPNWTSTPDTPPVSAASNLGPRPKVEVDREEFDFGTMERGTTKTHVFVFTNTGDLPLLLTEGKTTCKCTLSKLAKSSISPGESADVTLEWVAKTEAPEFRQTANIGTNDPEQPLVTLTISGLVAELLRVEPREYVFTKIEVDKPTSALVRLISVSDEPIKVLSHRFLDKETADRFELEVAKPSADSLPEGGPENVLALKVLVKPGLPVGLVQQQLEVTTNISGSSAKLIPIHGRVVSQISFFGRGWDANRSLLVLGHVSGRSGGRRELNIHVRGNDPEKIEMHVESVSTDLLKVSLGPPLVIKPGSLVRVPLIIEISPGSRQASFLGSNQGDSAEIMIRTNHEHAKQLRLHVRFAIE